MGSLSWSLQDIIKYFRVFSVPLPQGQAGVGNASHSTSMKKAGRRGQLVSGPDLGHLCTLCFCRIIMCANFRHFLAAGAPLELTDNLTVWFWDPFDERVQRFMWCVFLLIVAGFVLRQWAHSVSLH